MAAQTWEAWKKENHKEFLQTGAGSGSGEASSWEKWKRENTFAAPEQKRKAMREKYMQASGMDDFRKDFNTYASYGIVKEKANRQWAQNIQKQRDYFSRYASHFSQEELTAFNEELDLYESVVNRRAEHAKLQPKLQEYQANQAAYRNYTEQREKLYGEEGLRADTQLYKKPATAAKLAQNGDPKAQELVRKQNADLVQNARAYIREDGTVDTNRIEGDMSAAKKSMDELDAQIQSMDEQIAEADRYLTYGTTSTSQAADDRQYITIWKTKKTELQAEREKLLSRREQLGKQYNEITDVYYYIWAYQFRQMEDDANYGEKVKQGKERYDAEYQAYEEELSGNRAYLTTLALTPEENLNGAVAPLENEARRSHKIAVDITALTKEEQDNFYYLVSTGQDNLAVEYVQQIAMSNRRETLNEISEWAGTNTFTRLLSSVGYILAMPYAGYDMQLYKENMASTGAGGGIGFGATADALLGGAAQGLQEKGLFNTGLLSGTINESVPIVGGKGIGDAYQLGMSIIDSTVAGLIFGKSAAVMLGSKAASSAFNDAIEKGATYDQAVMQGIAQGISEALYEYISLDQLLSDNAANGLVKQALKQAGVEASEETMTSLTNAITDRLIMQDMSEFETMKREYMEDGHSEKDAESMAYRKMWEEIAFDGLGGFLSGGGMTLMYRSAYKRQAEFNKEAGNWADAAMKADKNSDIYKEGAKLRQMLDSGENISGEYMQGVFERLGEDASRQTNVAATEAAMTEDAESTAIDTRQAGHTEAEQQTIQEYEKSTDHGLVAFIKKVRGLSDQKYRAKISYTIGAATQRQVQDVKKLTGVDVSEYRNAITGGAIDHITKRHGAHGIADNSMRNDADIARIGYVLKNYDSVELLKDENGNPIFSTEWQNKDQTKAQMVKFAKKIDGTYYVVEAVPDSGKKTLRVVSAYLQKDSGSSTRLLNMGETPSQLTLKTPAGMATSAVDSIPQLTKAVNTGDNLAANGDNALLNNALTSLGVPNAAAESLAKNYDPADGISPEIYARGAAEAFFYGKSGLPEAELRNGKGLSPILTELQRSAAYRLAQIMKDTQKTTFGVEQNEYAAQLDPQLVSAVDAMAKLFHLKVRFGALGGNNGIYHSDTGLIELDMDPQHKGASNAFLFSVSHELGHAVRDRIGSKAWNEFAKYAVKTKGGEKVINAKQESAAEYSEYAVAREEVVCDFIGELLSDQKMLDTFCESIKGGEIKTETARGIVAAWRKITGILRGKGMKQTDTATAALVQRVQKQFNTDIENAENAVRQMQKALSAAMKEEKNTTSNDEVKKSFKGYDAATGRGIYESNFPTGTPKTEKGKVILDYIQNVWSKKPIPLIVRNSDGSTRTIHAQFDPTYSDDKTIRTDASKLMGGNRHGSASDQRVTLDLAHDYYKIASESEYNYSKTEIGKESETHNGVKEWHYFINDILFQEYGEAETKPYRVTINVKERSDGSFVYSYSAERQKKGTSTRQTLHADVTPTKDSGRNARSCIDSIYEDRSKSQPSEVKKSSKDKPAVSAYTERYGTEIETQVRSDTVSFSKKENGIHLESTDAERYAILSDVQMSPAKVNYEKLSNINLDEYNTRRKSDVERGIKQLADVLGASGVDLSNSYIDFPFQYSKASIGKSLHHQLEYDGSYQDYVKAMSCFDELIVNAVPIETHLDKKAGTLRENSDLKQVYVLVSAFRDGNSIIPVQFEVKEFYSAKGGLYLTVALTKIDTEVLEETPTDVSAGDTSPLFSMSTYSLRSIFENVNPADGRFLKYVPNEFLNKVQLEAKHKALKKQATEYMNYAVEMQKRSQTVPEKKSINDKQRDIDNIEGDLTLVGAENTDIDDVTETSRDTATLSNHGTKNDLSHGQHSDQEQLTVHSLLMETDASEVKNAIERKYLKEYQKTANRQLAEQRKLDKLQAELDALPKDKRRTTRARFLRDEIIKTKNRIKTCQSILTRLETNSPLTYLIRREIKPNLAEAQKNAMQQAQRAIDNPARFGIIKEEERTDLSIDHFLAMFSPEDARQIREILQLAPNEIIALFNCYNKHIRIDPNYKSGLSNYSWAEKTIRVNVSKMNVDVYKNVGRGQELFMKAYGELFHEVGHAIDNIAGRNMNEGMNSTRFSAKFISNKYKVTLLQALKKEVTHCIITYGKTKLITMLKDMPLIASSDVSDVFSSITKNRIMAYTGHDVKYYEKYGLEKAAAEAFAEMFSAEINNPDSLTNFKQFFPISYSIFKEMLKAILEIHIVR